MNAPHVPRTPPDYRGRGVEFSVFAELVVLLVVPVMALCRLSTWIDWRAVVGAPVAMSLVAYFLYRFDKRRAEANGQRVPEAVLHSVELLGGWPGAFLAQRIIRHKSSKTSYQIAFWLIVLVHELVALDFLRDWSLAKALVHFVRSRA